MNFTTSKSNLVNMIIKVFRSSQAKTSLPILGGILFDAKEDILTATSTDIDLTLQCSTSVHVLEEGKFCLPAKQIINLVKRLPDTTIQVKSLPESNSVKISYNGSEITINGYPPEQFPGLPKNVERIGFKLSQKLLKEMIKQTIFAVSNDKTRPLFTGVLFEADSQTFRLVATDTHRLALREVNLENIEPFENIIVPGQALLELNRIIGDEELIKIEISENHIFFIMDNALLISRLISGKFPVYRQIIPNNFISSLNALNSDMIDSLLRASVLIGDEVPVLHFSLSEDNCMTLLNTSSGGIKEKLKANYNGEPLDIFFNIRYLIESLRAIPTEEIIIKFTGSLSAAVVHPLDRTDYLSLLLPSRAQK